MIGRLFKLAISFLVFSFSSVSAQSPSLKEHYETFSKRFHWVDQKSLSFKPNSVYLDASKEIASGEALTPDFFDLLPRSWRPPQGWENHIHFIYKPVIAFHWNQKTDAFVIHHGVEDGQIFSLLIFDRDGHLLVEKRAIAGETGDEGCGHAWCSVVEDLDGDGQRDLWVRQQSVCEGEEPSEIVDKAEGWVKNEFVEIKINLEKKKEVLSKLCSGRDKN